MMCFVAYNAHLWIVSFDPQNFWNLMNLICKMELIIVMRMREMISTIPNPVGSLFLFSCLIFLFFFTFILGKLKNGNNLPFVFFFFS